MSKKDKKKYKVDKREFLLRRENAMNFVNEDDAIPYDLRKNLIAEYSTRKFGLANYALPVTNAVANGDFSNGTTGWVGDASVLTVADKIARVVGNGTTRWPGLLTITSTPLVPSAKYQGRVMVRVSDSLATSIIYSIRNAVGDIVGLGSVAPIANTWLPINFITAINARTGNLRIDIYATYADAATANGKVMEVQEVMCIDLSTPFGLSNEPTASEFSDMMAYKGKTFWSGTENVVINPNDKYYWPDRSGANRHLHAVNVAYDATGGVQAGPPANWLCDGVNDFLKVDSSTDIIPVNGAYSCNVVFQAKSAIGSPSRITQFSNLASTQSSFLDMSSTAITFTVNDSTSGTSVATVARNNFADTWYSVTVLYDPTTKKAGISINGDTIVWGSALTNGTRLINRLMLSSTYNNGSYSNCRTAEDSLYNKVLSQSEVKSIYNNVCARYQGLMRV